MALIGAAAGVFVLHALWPRFGTGDPHVFLVVLCAVAGAVAAASLQRWVIIVATAFGGAWTAIIGASALVDCLRLAATDYLVKGRSNLSDASLAFNPRLPYSFALR